LRNRAERSGLQSDRRARQRLAGAVLFEELWLAAAADGVGDASAGAVVLYRALSVKFMLLTTICVKLVVALAFPE
jgi:hypothetical protein